MNQSKVEQKIMPDNLISDDLKTLAGGYSLQVRYAGRIWLFMVSLLILALTLKSSQCPKLLGNEIDIKEFYIPFYVIITLLYVSFSVGHSQAIRACSNYQEVLKKMKGDSTFLAKDVKLSDVAHTLYQPGFNRIYPLAKVTEKWKWKWIRLDKIIYKVLKIGSFLLYVAAPLFFFFWVAWPLLPVRSWIKILFIIPSGVPCLLVLWQEFQWYAEQKRGLFPDESAS